MSKTFGSVVAGAVAGLFISGVAMAEGAKTPAAPAAAKDDKGDAGWCKSAECGGHVAGAKNSCKGAMACKGITKEACTKDGKGTWETGPKPTK
jgi:hypothetical protein